MTAAIIANLEKMLGGPRDGALLRFSLGNAALSDDELFALLPGPAAAGGGSPAR